MQLTALSLLSNLHFVSAVTSISNQCLVKLEVCLPFEYYCVVVYMAYN